MLNDLITILVLSLATASMSFTLARSKIFEKFRRWVSRKSNGLGYLVNCPYCVSHWIAAYLVLDYGPRPLEFWRPLDLVISIFTVIALSAMFIGLIGLAFPQRKAPSPVPPLPPMNLSPHVSGEMWHHGWTDQNH